MQLKKSLKNLGVKIDILVYFVTVQPVEAFLNSIIHSQDSIYKYILYIHFQLFVMQVNVGPNK